ncbi:transporter substrate-binding domain-containing protein [Brucella intermedia GD04153]|uniref:Transporter substrate-binding domain-containing protein n=1 Tax=Brucella intermedia GD04153 TaxID=2975438 RepID=A0AA42KVW4_9HYPH|nr:transporter substrate-binding domain-containing protein [Brucella intermedia]MDH0127042.1 transporter substrate-binding domain-containing protein [Brucella intermedia GD04153]
MKRLTIALALSLLATAASSADLRVGTSADYPPWESVDGSGNIVGFDKDVGDEICKRIGATCNWQNQAYDGLLPGLQIGKFDLVISGISINDERSKKVDFSVAYADAPNSIVVAAGSQAASDKTAADLTKTLAKSAIGVQTGTTHEQVVRAHFPDADVRVYDRPDQIADDLLAGRIDAGLMERSAWEPLVKERGKDKLVYAGPLLTGSDFSEFGKGQGVAMAKGKNELKGKVDGAVEAMLKDGTVKTISEKWFGYDVSKK